MLSDDNRDSNLTVLLKAVLLFIIYLLIGVLLFTYWDEIRFLILCNLAAAVVIFAYVWSFDGFGQAWDRIHYWYIIKRNDRNVK